jgi:hypothetical protein
MSTNNSVCIVMKLRRDHRTGMYGQLPGTFR